MASIMKYGTAIWILLFCCIAGIVKSAEPKKVTMPPIRGWTAIRWDMTRRQIVKVTGNPLKALKHGYYTAGLVSYYGYPTRLQVSFDKAGELCERDFCVLSKTQMDAGDLLNKIHGLLVAELGRPSLDGIGWDHPKGVYNTMWCGKTWTAFIGQGGWSTLLSPGKQ